LDGAAFRVLATGITNHPATKEATGLEVDKLDGKAVAKYMNTYLDSYKERWAPG